MALKFYGSLGELRDLLVENEIDGCWESKPNGVHMMRCAQGGNMHWASGSKTLWFDGPAVARARLTGRVEFAILTADDD